MEVEQVQTKEQAQQKENKPLLMAGPCSVETREGLLITAEQLKDSGIEYFRAGIWKPRTRPGQFEGVGAKGLKWLNEVKEKYGFKICTEVANFKHVYDALRNNIDMIWIGARTSSNPFAVQEIAESLSGVDIPVWVKNPINPDLGLWIGAIERFKKLGIKNVGAIHRGFSVYQKDKFRNPPKWQIPLGLKKEIPDMPIIVDPSHITGDNKLVSEISQMAFDLAFDGLMVEVHYDPKIAWSDAKQQITPTEFIDMVGNLKFPKSIDIEKNSIDDLSTLRSEIDLLDNEILGLFQSRMEMVKKIGKIKKEKNLTIFQNDRWKEILDRSIALAKSRGLSERFAEQVFKAIHQESIEHQTRIIRD